MSCILGVLKHEHVSSDFYTIWTLVLHDQCLCGRLFARLIGDSQPFWANPRCCPNSYEKKIQ